MKSSILRPLLCWLAVLTFIAACTPRPPRRLEIEGVSIIVDSSPGTARAEAPDLRASMLRIWVRGALDGPGWVAVQCDGVGPTILRGVGDGVAPSDGGEVAVGGEVAIIERRLEHDGQVASRSIPK